MPRNMILPSGASFPPLSKKIYKKSCLKKSHIFHNRCNTQAVYTEKRAKKIMHHEKLLKLLLGKSAEYK